jgi:hypothetical protein
LIGAEHRSRRCNALRAVPRILTDGRTDGGWAGCLERCVRSENKSQRVGVRKLTDAVVNVIAGKERPQKLVSPAGEDGSLIGRN